MTSIDETAHTMFGMGRMNPMTLLQTMREIKSILEMKPPILLNRPLTLRDSIRILLPSAKQAACRQT